MYLSGCNASFMHIHESRFLSCIFHEIKLKLEMQLHKLWNIWCVMWFLIAKLKVGNRYAQKNFLGVQILYHVMSVWLIINAHLTFFKSMGNEHPSELYSQNVYEVKIEKFWESGKLKDHAHLVDYSGTFWYKRQATAFVKCSREQECIGSEILNPERSELFFVFIWC